MKQVQTFSYYDGAILDIPNQETDSQTFDSQFSKNMHHIKRSLRYILTQNCNYHCYFCHKEGCEGNEKEVLDQQDYVFLYETMKKIFPIEEVTLSGGEPLMYKNIDSLIPYLHQHQLPLTLVSNGSLLHRHLDLLPYLKKLIVSLHTTQQDLYQNLVQCPVQVSSLIKTLLEIKKQNPQLSIVLNSTLLKEYIKRKTPFKDLLQFVKEHGFILKILEVSPSSDKDYISHDACIPFLEEAGFILNENTTDEQNPYKNKKTYQCGQAKIILRKCSCNLVDYYKLSENFCKKHNDIVISPDGYLGYCFSNTKQLPIYNYIKNADGEGLIASVKNLIGENKKYCIH